MNAKTKVDHDEERAIAVFTGLQGMGCSCSVFIGRRRVGFDGLHKPLRLKMADIPRYTRLIRQAAQLEQQGILIADIDRMGRVVGWHIKDRTGEGSQP